jgi:uncharacterized OB-fold protein
MTLPTPADVDPANPDTEFFWRGLRGHELLLQRCAECGTTRFPPMPGCPACGSDRTEIISCAGTGTVYSHIVVHRTPHPQLRAEVPYSILTVDLTEGARLVGRLSGSVRAEIGEPVRVTFVDHAEWTELRFRRDAT